MPKIAKTLTAPMVEKIKKPAAGQAEHWDASLPGFGLRITAKDRRSWVLMKRLKVGAKPLVRFTLGDFPTMTLADARRTAGEYIELIEAGGDPRDVKAQKLAEADERHRNTFKAIAAEFIEKYAKRENRSWRQVENIFKLHVEPRWGDKPVTTITRRDLLNLLDSLIDAGKSTTANRVLANIRKLFNWCIERGILEASPALQVKPPAGKEVPRERDLSDDEIRAIWGASEKLGIPFGVGLKTLLLLGQRRAEVFGMRWADIDLDKGEWILPRERTKAARSHVVPLSQMAIDVLKTIPRISYRPAPGKPEILSEYVFTTSGATPVSGFSKAKSRIEKLIMDERKKRAKETGDKSLLMPLPQWQMHDFRRTCATRLAVLGVPVDHIGRVLNHAPKGVTATVYDKHTYIPEKRHALDVWAKYLKGIVEPDTDDLTNVADFRRAKNGG